MENEMLVSYECMLIFHPDLSQDKIKEELEEIKKIVTSSGGKVLAEDVWGLKEMAYRIAKQSEGFYVVLNFDMPPAELKDLEKHISIQAVIIRYLLIKTPQNYEIKTLEQYAVEAKASAEKDEAERKEKEEKRAPKPAPRVAAAKPVREKKEVKPKPEKQEEEPVKEEKKPKLKVEEPKKEEIDEEKAAKTKLQEMDDKLRSIIDDPDITL